MWVVKFFNSPRISVLFEGESRSFSSAVAVCANVTLKCYIFRVKFQPHAPLNCSLCHVLFSHIPILNCSRRRRRRRRRRRSSSSSSSSKQR